MGARRVAINYFDDVEDLAVTPAAVATLPITNLQNDIRGDVYRSPNLDVQTIVGSWGGGGRRISHASFWPGLGLACLLGAEIRLRLFSDALRVSQVYDSGWSPVFDFAAEVDFSSDLWGAEHDDLTVRQVALLLWFSAVSAGSFEISIRNGGAVDTPYFELRRIWLGDYVEAPYNAEHGLSSQPESGSSQKRSRGGGLQRARRGQWNGGAFEIVLETDAQRAAWRGFCTVADPAAEVIVSLFQRDAGDDHRLERDFSWMGSMKVANKMVWEDYNFHRLQIDITES